MYGGEIGSAGLTKNLESLTAHVSTPEKLKKKWLPVSQRQLLIT